MMLYDSNIWRSGAIQVIAVNKSYVNEVNNDKHD